MFLKMSYCLCAYFSRTLSKFFRNSHPEVFLVKGVPKICFQSVISMKLYYMQFFVWSTGLSKNRSRIKEQNRTF